jgi:hypothetical protein
MSILNEAYELRKFNNVGITNPPFFPNTMFSSETPS